MATLIWALAFGIPSPASAWDYKSGVDPLSDKAFGYASEYSERGGPIPIWMGVKCWVGGDVQLMFWFPSIQYTDARADEKSTALIRVDGDPPFPMNVTSSQFGPAFGLVGHSSDNPLLYLLLDALTEAKQRIVAVINKQSYVISTKGLNSAMSATRKRCTK